MAEQRHAVARIRYLIGAGPYQATPRTITGNATEIYSYDLMIADRWDMTEFGRAGNPITGWMIHTDLIGADVVPPGTKHPYFTPGRKSRTTDRHIRAALIALADE